MKGMMWYDPDPTKPLEQKIKDAAEAYRKKLNSDPDTAWVNPNADGQAPQGIILEKSRFILPNNVLIGKVEN